jgi:hypothetical protein
VGGGELEGRMKFGNLIVPVSDDVMGLVVTTVLCGPPLTTTSFRRLSLHHETREFIGRTLHYPWDVELCAQASEYM